MRLFCLFILSLFLSSFSTKPLVETENGICKKHKASFSLPKALQEIKSKAIKDSVYLACLHHQIALDYYYKSEYVSALKHNKEAIKIREQIKDNLLWRTYHNMAVVNHKLNNYSKAIEYNQLAYNSNGFKNPKDSINILRLLSTEYAAIGDIEQALQYGNIAIKVNAKNVHLANAFNSIGLILINTLDSANVKLGISHLNKALNYINIEDKKAKSIYINKGVGYGYLNKNETALKQYNLALKILPKEDTLSKAFILNNMGVELIDQKKYNRALEKIEASLKLKQAYFSEEPFEFEYSFNYDNIADAYFEMKNYDSALKNYQNAIVNLTNSFRSTHVFENPVLTDSLYVYSNLVLIRVLASKAKTALALYRQNGDTAYLRLTHKTCLTLLDFHNQLQNEIVTENSRLFQAKNLLPYIENGLDAIYEMQANGISIGASAFRLMEKNKATVLMQSINEAQALQYANLPDAILEQEGELKTTISFYKKQLNDAAIYEEHDNIDKFDKLLFEEENKYKQLIQNLESNYPDYYQLKYRQNEIQLKDTKNYLDEGTALLEYFVGDSSIYVLSIQKEKSKLYKKPKPKNWNDLIYNFKHSVTHIDFIQKEKQAAFELFNRSGFELFSILLQPVFADLEKNITHLKIIPDAELNYIPFDILLTGPASSKQINYANLSYLLNDKTLSYAYSTALLLESNHPQQTENNTLALYAGFAPVYKPAKAFTKTLTSTNVVLRSGELADLPNARISVQQIANFINGQAFLATEATKKQFIHNAKQFKIIHLATHGFLNDDNPLYSNLVFTGTVDSTDNLLYAADLYNVELNADLVVLSACNTGTGKLQKGEGVMSLSRAFTYAGSASLVMSLWEVPDKSTAAIMQSFFKYLKKGYTKDKALQSAKLAFIKNRPERAHPLFWAGFIPSGNMATIHIEKEMNYGWLWLLIIAAIFISGGIALRQVSNG